MIAAYAAQWAGIFCLLVWGKWLCRRLGVPFGFAPVLGIVFTMPALQFAGMLRLLLPGAVLLYTGAAVLLWRGGRRGWRECLLSPGVLGFVTAAAAAQIVFALHAPVFQTWDEFSHWGIFFKSVFYQRCLAQWLPGRALVHTAYPQGVPALYALFRLFLPAYREQDVFFTVDLVLFAAAGAAFSLAVPRQPGPSLWRRLCAAAGTPLLFCLFTCDTPYTTVYMDAPVAAVFAAGVALLFLPPPADTARLQRGLAVGLTAAAAASVKEIGMAFALCLLGIWFVQCLLARRRFWRSFVPAAALAAAAVLSWKVFLAAVHRSTDQFSSMDAGYFLQTVQEAFSGYDPYLFTIWHRFWHCTNTTALLLRYNAIQLAVGCTVLGLVLAAALWRLRRTEGGTQLAVIPLCMTLFWPCYMAVLFYVYICGMSPWEAESMASFSRYAACYFIPWLAALLCAAWQVWDALPWPPVRLGLQAVQAGALAAVSLGSLLSGTQALAPSAPDWRVQEQATAQKIAAMLPGGGENAVLHILSADSETALQNLYYYQYELYPLMVDINTLDPVQDAGKDLGTQMTVSAADYLLLFGLAPDFAGRYAAAADDGLAAAAMQPFALYCMQEDSGRLRLTLCTVGT